MKRVFEFPISGIPEDFGVRLSSERRALKWSQARLAKLAGVRRETISRLERGATKPVADTVFRLEKALDLEAGTLVPAWPEWAPLESSSYGAASRRRRLQRGLSLEAVAKKTGISQATVSRFEREVQAPPSLVRIGRTGLDTELQSLVSLDYAQALGFSSVREHEQWCENGGD